MNCLGKYKTDNGSPYVTFLILFFEDKETNYNHKMIDGVGAISANSMAQLKKVIKVENPKGGAFWTNRRLRR